MNDFGLQPVNPNLVIWAARRTVLQHAEPPAEGRRTGRCAHCGEGDPCPCLVGALHYLRIVARLA